VRSSNSLTIDRSAAVAVTQRRAVHHQRDTTTRLALEGREVATNRAYETGVAQSARNLIFSLLPSCYPESDREKELGDTVLVSG
jgi:hypothetical protein